MTDYTALIEKTEKYMNEEVSKNAHIYDTNCEFPQKYYDEIVSWGIFELLLNPSNSKEVRVFYEIIRIISQSFAALGSILMAQGIYGISAIYLLGTEEQKRQYLPAMLTGKHMASFAINEEGGSSLGPLKTSIKEVGDKYILNGSKHNISNSPIANTFILVGKGSKGYGLVMIDLPNDNLIVSEALDKMGVHALPVGNIKINNLKFCKQHLLGETWQTTDSIDNVMKRIRLATAYQALGISQGVLKSGLIHGREERNIGKRLIDLVSFQNQFTSLMAKVEAGEVYLKDIAENYSEDKEKTSKAKLYASELAVEATRKIIDIIGGVAYFSKGDVERYYRDALVTTLYGGSIKTQQEIMMQPWM